MRFGASACRRNERSQGFSESSTRRAVNQGYLKLSQPPPGTLLSFFLPHGANIPYLLTSMNRLRLNRRPNRMKRRHGTNAKARGALFGAQVAFWGVIALLAGSFALYAGSSSAALTLNQLRSDPCLTPERFMTYFRDFQFAPGESRQAPEVFLATKSGDCEDFASLAAEILQEKKYTTTLIAVSMNGQAHVVCYVKEVHGYLDYNLRKEPCAVQPAEEKLEAVAEKVAAYFRTLWRYASEFTYQEGRPRFGRIVFR